MERIINVDNRIDVYKIESVLYTGKIINDSYNALVNLLSTFKDRNIKESDAIQAISFAWHIIDNSYRYLRTMKQIRGVKHKEPRLRRAINFIDKIEVFRNYIQHINSQIDSLPSEIFPVLGAISWPSENNTKSNTISLGSMPEGTTMNSLSFDTNKKEYIGGVCFNVLNVVISLTELVEIYKSVNSYLYEWLQQNNNLSADMPEVNFLSVGDLNIRTGKRYLRVKMTSKDKK